MVQAGESNGHLCRPLVFKDAQDAYPNCMYSAFFLLVLECKSVYCIVFTSTTGYIQWGSFVAH